MHIIQLIFSDTGGSRNGSGQSRLRSVLLRLSANSKMGMVKRRRA
jgi:hypothetical protein